MPPKAKPSVKIDEDGDGDTDVTVEIDTPPAEPGQWPAGLRDALNLLVGRMEVVTDNRITYSGARETIRGLLANIS